MLMWHIRDVKFGTNQLERLAAFNALLTGRYNARSGSNRLLSISLANITAEGWGDFSGPAIKAAMTKEATPFCIVCRSLLARWGRLRGVHAGCRAWPQGCYGVMDGQDLIITPASLRKPRHTCTTFGHDSMRRREHVRAQNLMSWQTTTKVHKMQHIPALARMLNPKHISCYIDESSIGTTTTVWKRSLMGEFQCHSLEECADQKGLRRVAET